MSLLVTGSIGIDTVKTPFGLSEDCLGGSAVYFSMAASFFTPVRFVGVIGGDCPFNLHTVFQNRPVDLAGLEIRPNSKTFRWHGSYLGAMNEANTDAVELNVLAEDPPKIPDAFQDSQCVFLANTAPNLQIRLLDSLQSPQRIVADTMNLWINNARSDLKLLLKKITGLVVNEGEAVLLTDKPNLITAAKEIIKMGPKFVVVKKGEHGTLLMTAEHEIFALPAFPTDRVVDPTGAGDSFAGGMMGYLASQPDFNLSNLKRAIAYGTCTASLVIEDFSLNRWNSASRADIEQRFQQLKSMMQFE